MLVVSLCISGQSQRRGLQWSPWSAPCWMTSTGATSSLKWPTRSWRAAWSSSGSTRGGECPLCWLVSGSLRRRSDGTCCWSLSARACPLRRLSRGSITGLSSWKCTRRMAYPARKPGGRFWMMRSSMTSRMSSFSWDCLKSKPRSRQRRGCGCWRTCTTRGSHRKRRVRRSSRLRESWKGLLASCTVRKDEGSTAMPKPRGGWW